MGKLEVYTCETCHAVLIHPGDGVLIFGPVEDACPKDRKKLIEHRGVEGFPLCKVCLAKHLGIKVEHTRYEDRTDR